MPQGQASNQTNAAQGNAPILYEWKRRALGDAIIVGVAALLFIGATVVLVGTAGDTSDATATATAIGPLGNGLALVLLVAALTTFLAGSWFIARRLRDLRTIDDDNRQLAEALLGAADAERTKLGQNLHDDLGQHLTGIGMLSASLHNRLTSVAPQLADDADRLSRLAEEASHRTRAITRACLIDWTERAGLAQSLVMLGASASELFGIPIETRIDGRLDTPDPATGSHITRIVSEAINNAARHADPHAILVSLAPMASGPRSAMSSVELIIEDRRSDQPPSAMSADAANAPDNAEADQPLPGLGMLIMRARARAIGGELEAISNQAHGMTIRCVFPWKAAGSHQHQARNQERARKHAATKQEHRADQVAGTRVRVIPMLANTPDDRGAIAPQHESPEAWRGHANSEPTQSESLSKHSQTTGSR